MSLLICKHCSRKDIKLWRESGYLVSGNCDVRCKDCLLLYYNRYGIDSEDITYGARLCHHISYMRPDGTIPSLTFGTNQRTDQIGAYVPAVESSPGCFWGYTSVPEEQVRHWKSLPNN